MVEHYEGRVRVSMYRMSCMLNICAQISSLSLTAALISAVLLRSPTAVSSRLSVPDQHKYIWSLWLRRKNAGVVCWLGSPRCRKFEQIKGICVNCATVLAVAIFARWTSDRTRTQCWPSARKPLVTSSHSGAQRATPRKRSRYSNARNVYQSVCKKSKSPWLRRKNAGVVC